MKFFLNLFLLLASSGVALGQTIWSDAIADNFTPYTTQSGPVNTGGNGARMIATNLSVSGVQNGLGVTPSTVRTSNPSGSPDPGARRATGWTTGNSLNANDYFEFTLTPAAGRKIKLARFVYDGTRNGDGPTNYELRYAISPSTTYIAVPGSSVDDDGSVDLSATAFQNITTSITFRLYAWNADESDGYFQINSFSFTGAITLPVDFGAISAVEKDEGVNIQWTTLKEANNSHFEIEASKDGKAFTTVKTVQSKNGNSDVSQNYEVNIAASDVASLLGIPALLGLLSLGWSRRKRLAVGAVALVMLGVNFVSCSKQGDTIDVNTIDKVFIRIKQVDKDGSYKYSEVIQVVRK